LFLGGGGATTVAMLVGLSLRQQSQ